MIPRLHVEWGARGFWARLRILFLALLALLGAILTLGFWRRKQDEARGHRDAETEGIDKAVERMRGDLADAGVHGKEQDEAAERIRKALAERRAKPLPEIPGFTPDSQEIIERIRRGEGK